MDGDLIPGLGPNLNVEPVDFKNAFWGIKFDGYGVLHSSLKRY